MKRAFEELETENFEAVKKKQKILKDLEAEEKSIKDKIGAVRKDLDNLPGIGYLEKLVKGIPIASFNADPFGYTMDDYEVVDIHSPEPLEPGKDVILRIAGTVTANVSCLVTCNGDEDVVINVKVEKYTFNLADIEKAQKRWNFGMVDKKDLEWFNYENEKESVCTGIETMIEDGDIKIEHDLSVPKGEDDITAAIHTEVTAVAHVFVPISMWVPKEHYFHK